MFKKLFGGQKQTKSKEYEEGWKLFELGMAHASQYDCEKALAYYSKSISVCENPAPYINRANILCKRIRYYEALQDLLEARRLDKMQANESADVLQREIGMAEAITHTYRNGLRENLIADLENNGESYVVGKIYCAAFGFRIEAWNAGFVLPNFAEYHFFNELDNVKKFDRLDIYPEVSEYLELYPESFINEKLDNFPDYGKYREAELKLHSFLCAYDQKTMVRLRRVMLYNLHERLLASDYPGIFGFSNPRPEVIMDAHKLVYGKEYGENEHESDEKEGDDAVWIGGFLFDGDIDSDEVVAEIVTKLSGKIHDLAPTELDVYRYLVEEAERFSKGGRVERNILDISGISPLEYEGQIEKSGKYPDSRSSLEFLNNEVSPELERLLSPERAADIRAFIFSNIVLRDENQMVMLKLRQKYAVHYCNNCSANGHWTYHDKWAEVISEIDAQIERIT